MYRKQAHEQTQTLNKIEPSNTSYNFNSLFSYESYRSYLQQPLNKKQLYQLRGKYIGKNKKMYVCSNTSSQLFGQNNRSPIQIISKQQKRVRYLLDNIVNKQKIVQQEKICQSICNKELNQLNEEINYNQQFLRDNVQVPLNIKDEQQQKAQIKQTNLDINSLQNVQIIESIIQKQCLQQKGINKIQNYISSQIIHEQYQIVDVKYQSIDEKQKIIEENIAINIKEIPSINSVVNSTDYHQNIQCQTLLQLQQSKYSQTKFQQRNQNATFNNNNSFINTHEINDSINLLPHQQITQKQSQESDCVIIQVKPPPFNPNKRITRLSQFKRINRQKNRQKGHNIMSIKRKQNKNILQKKIDQKQIQKCKQNQNQQIFDGNIKQLKQNKVKDQNQQEKIKCKQQKNKKKLLKDNSRLSKNNNRQLRNDNRQQNGNSKAKQTRKLKNKQKQKRKRITKKHKRQVKIKIKNSYQGDSKIQQKRQKSKKVINQKNQLHQKQAQDAIQKTFKIVIPQYHQSESYIKDSHDNNVQPQQNLLQAIQLQSIQPIFQTNFFNTSEQNHLFIMNKKNQLQGSQYQIKIKQITNANNNQMQLQQIQQNEMNNIDNEIYSLVSQCQLNKYVQNSRQNQIQLQKDIIILEQNYKNYNKNYENHKRGFQDPIIESHYIQIGKMNKQNQMIQRNFNKNEQHKQQLQPLKDVQKMQMAKQDLQNQNKVCQINRKKSNSKVINNNLQKSIGFQIKQTEKFNKLKQIIKRSILNNKSLLASKQLIKDNNNKFGKEIVQFQMLAKQQNNQLNPSQTSENEKNKENQDAIIIQNKNDDIERNLIKDQQRQNSLIILEQQQNRINVQNVHIQKQILSSQSNKQQLKNLNSIERFLTNLSTNKMIDNRNSKKLPSNNNNKQILNKQKYKNGICNTINNQSSLQQSQSLDIPLLVDNKKKIQKLIKQTINNHNRTDALKSDQNYDKNQQLSKQQCKHQNFGTFNNQSFCSFNIMNQQNSQYRELQNSNQPFSQIKQQNQQFNVAQISQSYNDGNKVMKFNFMRSQTKRQIKSRENQQIQSQAVHEIQSQSVQQNHSIYASSHQQANYSQNFNNHQFDSSLQYQNLNSNSKYMTDQLQSGEKYPSLNVIKNKNRINKKVNQTLDSKAYERNNQPFHKFGQLKQTKKYNLRSKNNSIDFNQNSSDVYSQIQLLSASQSNNHASVASTNKKVSRYLQKGARKVSAEKKINLKKIKSSHDQRFGLDITSYLKPKHEHEKKQQKQRITIQNGLKFRQKSISQYLFGSKQQKHDN